MGIFIDLSVITKEQRIKFWTKVKIASEDSCWLWQGAKAGGKRVKEENKYGTFYINNIQKPAAHRVAYFLYYGVDPGELLVCHTCDNPPCCNPLHFFLGDDKANMADMVKKGRQNNRKTKIMPTNAVR